MVTREEIELKVNTFLKEDLEIEAELTPESRLHDDLGIDSLDFVDIVVIVERDFGFKIVPAEMQGVETLGQFYDYVENKINNPAPEVVEGEEAPAEVAEEAAPVAEEAAPKAEETPEA